MQSVPRSLGLDILRAIAVLMVLIRHSVPCPRGLSELGYEVHAWLIRGAWTGVDLFFVLSGFLVGGLLLQEYKTEGRLQIGRFLARRGFKIYPSFWICLGFIVCWQSLIQKPVSAKQIWAELLFYQNYIPAVSAPNWSLAVEEHFYILLPLVLVFLARNSDDPHRAFRRLPVVVGLVIVGCFAARLWTAVVHEGEAFNTYVCLTPTHLRIDGLFFGVLLAYFHTFSKNQFLSICRQYRWPLLILGMAGFLPAFTLPLEESWFIQVFGLAFHWMASGAILCFILGTLVPDNLFTRFIAGIGRCSYATYLWHVWVGFYGVPMFLRLFYHQISWPVFSCAYFAGTLIVGAIFTWLIEQPFLRLRNRFIPSSPRTSLAVGD